MDENRNNRKWQVTGRNFSVEFGMTEEKPVLTLNGEIDVYTFPTLSRAIDDVVAAGFNNISLDFSNVSFLDSGGISVLIRAHKILKDRQGKLDLDRVHGHALRVLEITGLTDFLNVHRLNHNMAA